MIQPSTRTLIGLLVPAGLAGCANFGQVADFARQTAQVATRAGDEMEWLQDLCRQQAELVIVVNDITDEGPLKDCAREQAAQGRLARVTVDVLAAYASLLSSLADDRTLDLGPEVRALGPRVQALADAAGGGRLDAERLAALGRVSALMVDVATSARREEAVRRLVAAAPGFRRIGEGLRSFFVASTAPSGGPDRAPYASLVALASSSIVSTQASLASPALKAAEPIRTAELRRQLQARTVQLQTRRSELPAGVPMRIAAAIEAWLQALDSFAAQALQPEPLQLLQRLADLREQVASARVAVDAAR